MPPRRAPAKPRLGIRFHRVAVVLNGAIPLLVKVTEDRTEQPLRFHQKPEFGFIGWHGRLKLREIRGDIGAKASHSGSIEGVEKFVTRGITLGLAQSLLHFELQRQNLHLVRVWTLIPLGAEAFIGFLDSIERLLLGGAVASPDGFRSLERNSLE